MTRFARVRRRPDHWTSPHDRARARASERMDGPLGLAEATWLEEHLADCAECSAIATAYLADREALRDLRSSTIEPPRDLWARTAAGIETAAAGGGRSGIRWSRSAAAVSGIAVLVVFVGLGGMSAGLFGGSTPGPITADASPIATASEPSATSAATTAPTTAPTPLAVGAGDVHWIGTGVDGSFAYSGTEVREVCPLAQAQDCALLDPSPGERLALATAPKSIIGSPSQSEAVVVSDDGAGGHRITVLALPTPTPTSTPTPDATPVASGDPSASPEPTPDGSIPPPSATAEPSPSVGPDPTASPPASPEPTVATELAIASGVTVVGESAAYSADGSWFAFTARPTDGLAGPDVYVWKVGDPTARRLTSDGLSSFASWDGGQVVVSRPGSESIDGISESVSGLIDPETGAERAAGGVWHPVVDPTGTRAVAWSGTVATDADPIAIRPAVGRLELRSWVAGEGIGEGASQVVDDGIETSFDVRWDETGTWFAMWIADPSGNEVGRLSLYHVDPASGRIAQPDGAPQDVPALAGFSIGSGRLAWATPPGQDGEGSRVQIVAWADDGVGTVETVPGEELVVVRWSTADRPGGRAATRRGGVSCRLIVRPRWLVVGSVLTAALALVALPGLAGSRAPSAVGSRPGRRVPAALDPRVTMRARRSRSQARRRLRVGGCRSRAQPVRRARRRPRPCGPTARRTADQPEPGSGTADKPPMYTLSGQAHLLRPRNDRDAATTGHDRGHLWCGRLHRAGRHRLWAPEAVADRGPVPTGLLQDLRLPVVERRHRCDRPGVLISDD